MKDLIFKFLDSRPARNDPILISLVIVLMGLFTNLFTVLLFIEVIEFLTPWEYPEVVSESSLITALNITYALGIIVNIWIGKVVVEFYDDYKSGKTVFNCLLFISIVGYYGVNLTHFITLLWIYVAVQITNFCVWLKEKTSNAKNKIVITDITKPLFNAIKSNINNK